MSSFTRFVKRTSIARMNYRGVFNSPITSGDRDLLLTWSSGGIAKPHPQEWTPIEKGSFEPEYKFVEQIDGVLRPYVVLPITLMKNPGKEYPVTFLGDSGSPRFFLAHELFNIYRQQFNATKYVNLYIYLH